MAGPALRAPYGVAVGALGPSLERMDPGPCRLKPPSCCPGPPLQPTSRGGKHPRCCRSLPPRWHLPCHAWLDGRRGVERMLPAFGSSEMVSYTVRLRTSDLPGAGEAGG